MAVNEKTVGHWFCEVCNRDHPVLKRSSRRVGVDCPKIGYVYSYRGLEMPRPPPYGEMSKFRILLREAMK